MEEEIKELIKKLSEIYKILSEVREITHEFDKVCNVEEYNEIGVEGDVLQIKENIERAKRIEEELKDTAILLYRIIDVDLTAVERKIYREEVTE